MLFRVENLGPIREAEVDLSKPLIVFAGPNNSGKTYFAWFERFSLNKGLPSVTPIAGREPGHTLLLRRMLSVECKTRAADR